MPGLCQLKPHPAYPTPMYTIISSSMTWSSSFTSEPCLVCKTDAGPSYWVTTKAESGVLRTVPGPHPQLGADQYGARSFCRLGSVTHAVPCMSEAGRRVGFAQQGKECQGRRVRTVLGPAQIPDRLKTWDQAPWTHRGTLCLDPLALTLRGLDLPPVSVSDLPAGLAHHPPQL